MRPKQTGVALRSLVASKSAGKRAISEFVEQEVHWRTFNQTLREARAAFADLPADELQGRIDEAVEEVRARRYRLNGQL
jgi:hypothetical protein